LQGGPVFREGYKAKNPKSEITFIVKNNKKTNFETNFLNGSKIRGADNSKIREAFNMMIRDFKTRKEYAHK
jgi:hypothetical protein